MKCLVKVGNLHLQLPVGAEVSWIQTMTRMISVLLPPTAGGSCVSEYYVYVKFSCFGVIYAQHFRLVVQIYFNFN